MGIYKNFLILGQHLYISFSSISIILEGWKMKLDKTWDKYEDFSINRGLTKLRIRKLKVMYRMIYNHLNKSLDKLKKEEIEEYITKINKDLIKKKDGNPLSSSTKSDIKKFLKQFFKWHKGENAYYPSEVNWIDVKIPKDQKPEPKSTINLDEVKRLAMQFKRIEYKLLILLLFDSGFRINELKSVKKKDLTWEEYDDQGNKCFWIYCNESKTEKRKVPVPLFTEDLQAYFNSAEFQTRSSDELLFDVHYESVLKMLRNRSKKLFNKKITFHSLRHSSATYYAREFDGDIIMLCDRYGWSYGSKQPQIYVRRTGTNQIKSVKKVYSNDLVKVREENANLKQQMEQMKNQIKTVQKSMQQMMDMNLKSMVKMGMTPEDFKKRLLGERT